MSDQRWQHPASGKSSFGMDTRVVQWKSTGARRYHSVRSKRRTVPRGEQLQGRQIPRGRMLALRELAQAGATTRPEGVSAVLIAAKSVMDKEVTGLPTILSNDPVISFGRESGTGATGELGMFWESCDYREISNIMLRHLKHRKNIQSIIGEVLPHLGDHWTDDKANTCDCSG